MCPDLTGIKRDFSPLEEAGDYKRGWQRERERNEEEIIAPLRLIVRKTHYEYQYTRL